MKYLKYKIAATIIFLIFGAIPLIVAFYSPNDLWAGLLMAAISLICCIALWCYDWQDHIEKYK